MTNGYVQIHFVIEYVTLSANNKTFIAAPVLCYIAKRIHIHCHYWSIETDLLSLKSTLSTE